VTEPASTPTDTTPAPKSGRAARTA
jgi:hypothetical protein